MIVDLKYKREEVLQDLKSDKGSYSNYIIFNAKEFNYNNDKKTFENSIEVLDVIKTIHSANEFYKKAKSEIRISTQIYYKAIESIFSNIPFNDIEITEYYNMQVMVEDFFSAIFNFKELDNYVPFVVEFSLFGLSIESHDNLNEKQRDELHEKYGDIFCDIRFRKIEIEDGIAEIKKLVNQYL